MKITLALLAALVGVAPGAPAQTAPLGVSVVTYGAAPDNRTDSTAAIQHAIDDVAQRAGGGRIVFPSGQGCYVVSAPLTIRASGVFLEGEANRAFNDAGPCLRTDGYVGPLLHITNPANQANLALTSSLVAGPGQALATTAAGQNTATYVDLQDASVPAQLNGLPAFTAELFFRITSAPARGGGPVVLLASFGNLGPNETSGYAFGFEVSETLELTGRMTIGGEAARVGGFVLSLNTVYHTALTYDGASVRLFAGTPGRPSTLVGTVAARGPVTQAPFEMMPIGGRRSPWPRGGPYTNPIDGVMDSIRLSRTARYTAPFATPAAKLVFDADTLILENFDREASGNWSIVRTSLGGLTYLPKYRYVRGRPPRKHRSVTPRAPARVRTGHLGLRRPHLVVSRSVARRRHIRLHRPGQLPESLRQHPLDEHGTARPRRPRSERRREWHHERAQPDVHRVGLRHRAGQREQHVRLALLSRR